MFRALRPAMQDPERRELSSLFLYAAVAIPVFYLPALFYGPHTNFAIIDNWRFWIIHLWVEGFFELFATVLVAVMFHQMGLVSTKTATRLIYLDAILYLGGGIIGTGHHWYFTGQGTLNMGLASCFSALEVVPLTLLTLDAWDFIRLKNQACSDCGQDWPQAELGHLVPDRRRGLELRRGRDLRVPDQPADRVLLRGGHHAHPQPRPCRHVRRLRHVGPGGDGLLPAGDQSDEVWKETEKFVRIGFWGLNMGLGLMMLLDLFPAGRTPALGFRGQRLLARPPAGIHHGRHLPHAGMDAHGGRPDLPLRRRLAHHLRRVAQCVEKRSLSHAIRVSGERAQTGNNSPLARTAQIAHRTTPPPGL